MHSYLRAIGFHQNMRKSVEKEMLTNLMEYLTNMEVATDLYDNEFVEMTMELADGIGIKICGEYGDDGTFYIDYYFPYFQGSSITEQDTIEIDQHMEHESYAGICDDTNLGVSLIFYLQNVAEYLNRRKKNPKYNYNLVSLSGLSLEGRIIMPINRDEKKDKQKEESENVKKRNHLIAAAKEGDEEAIESLTLEDIDTYSMLSRRIIHEDVLSIVESSFIPFGIECDQYSVIGDILDYRYTINSITNEKICILEICCNDIYFDICINDRDLLGEPAVGRRFKGVVWLQGILHSDECA